ncbi:AAA family ATPase [Rhizobium leguminosarum]|uniref:AAA family ATPase n=1 Tax=Rhizobium leguminosarum TaxID=384 RepID=UPI001C95D26C|nr:ATP-binding protein [Rhizobium leguminosarum]MBY5315446.1 AAA family ATPase [Rhizobium leguminosarum]
MEAKSVGPCDQGGLDFPILLHCNYTFQGIIRGIRLYISEIYAAGYRCFAPDAPLQLKLSPGLNILAGSNDAGKSAIIDAARYVLWTRGDD